MTRKAGKAPTQPSPAKRRPRGGYERWTKERKLRYLDEFRRTGQPGLAAKALGSSKRQVARVREADPEFDEACEDAWRDYQEWVIGQVQKHAWEGVHEPIYQGGKLVGVRTVYNTQMMVLEARRVVPEYRERQHLEHGSDGKPIKLQMAWVPEALRGKVKPEEGGDE